ncbi:MAG: type IV secretory system conjugative DNA transfer family protein [Thermomicrobiales bacterium]|nr:type IV secretory system conjugative DNA transfer family protein [Thermomicrobiales bacterium]
MANLPDTPTRTRMLIERSSRGIAVFLVGLIPVGLIGWWIGQSFTYGYGTAEIIASQIGLNVLSGLVGLLLGFGITLLFGRHRDIVAALLALLLVFLAIIPGVGFGIAIITGIVAIMVGAALAWKLLYVPKPKATTFGSAEWATPSDVVAAELTKGKGFILGDFQMEEHRVSALHYGGDRHLLTVAPTRAGKGIAAIIPNLLTYQGSALVIDPKGENALITGAQRAQMGQQIMLVDPWDMTATRMGTQPARFNPIEWLHPDDPDIAENTMLLADALVVSTGSKEKFWDEEAKALLVGLILYVATDADEEGHRNLGRVRDLLMLTKDGMNELFGHMAVSDQAIVASTGARSLLKKEELLSNVLATAQSHTHFLDSPRIRESLSASDFQFEDLKADKMTIYLVLPADRLSTFGRWLRLLIQQAITVNARNIDQKPNMPVLFMLDEMPALGHLAMVEQAYGLMAGFGLQLWGIVQDLSQLKRIYGDGWETFIGNSGVLQYFGSRDQMTAEYFSKLCGVTTVHTFGESISRAVTSALNGNSTSDTTSTSVSNAQRNLAYPDELMRLADHRQLLLVQNHNPIAAIKTPWFERASMREKGVDIRKLASKPAPEAGGE